MTSKNSDDDRIRKITEMLEKGGTMLATHHECGAPLFRYQGEVLCPVCSSHEHDNTDITQTFEASENKGTGLIDKNNLEGLKNPEIPGRAKLKPKVHLMEGSDIDRIIMKKVTELAKSLENESDHRRMLEQLECMEKGLTILKLLREPF